MALIIFKTVAGFLVAVKARPVQAPGSAGDSGLAVKDQAGEGFLAGMAWCCDFEGVSPKVSSQTVSFQSSICSR